MSELVLCADFGSTYTKVAAVDLGSGTLAGTANHQTTLHTDVLDGLDACRERLGVPAGTEVVACSSAGGGLQIAVVGNEELVTTEAGRRVALSSGGWVVHVSYGAVDVGALTVAGSDVVLLVGGTDGGDGSVLLANARALAEAGWATPVVVAGNAEATPEIEAMFDEAGLSYVTASNVVPQIGVLRPGSARAAIREMFLLHVIGGKGLSSRTDFAAMVRGATPDVVLSAVELLAVEAGDVVVVDIGGATTDVHSVIDLDPEDATLSREVVAPVPVSRTVEADLGMRWSAVSTAEAAVEAGLDDGGLLAGAGRRRDDPSMLPSSAADDEVDLAIGAAAATIALRRHAGRQRVVFAPDGRLVERSGKDLREVAVLVGSGGVLRHHEPEQAHAVLAAATGSDIEGGWLVPRAPRVVIDRSYVLAAAGLLSIEHRDVATALLREHLLR